MKIDLVQALVFSLIRNEKDKVHTAFNTCIANEKEGNVKSRLKYMYEEYKRREGLSVIENLDYRIKDLLSAPYRDCSFNDLFLHHEIQVDTQKLLLEWKNKDYLLSNGLFPSHKILLEGPPGNGKTSYAIALANELGLPLLNTSSSSVLDSYLGKSEQNINTIFRYLPEACVLFFDEFEALSTSRINPGKDSGGSGRAWNSIVTSFLVNMEFLRPSCLFIAATNRSDMMDSAVVRRFDMILRFENPTEDEKEAFINNYLGIHGLKPDDFYVDKKEISNASSYSALENILQKRHKEILLNRLQ